MSQTSNCPNCGEIMIQVVSDAYSFLKENRETRSNPAKALWYRRFLELHCNNCEMIIKHSEERPLTPDEAVIWAYGEGQIDADEIKEVTDTGPGGKAKNDEDETWFDDKIKPPTGMENILSVAKPKGKPKRTQDQKTQDTTLVKAPSSFIPKNFMKTSVQPPINTTLPSEAESPEKTVEQPSSKPQAPVKAQPPVKTPDQTPAKTAVQAAKKASGKGHHDEDETWFNESLKPPPGMEGKLEVPKPTRSGKGKKK